jgi:hypothetical protein
MSVTMPSAFKAGVADRIGSSGSATERTCPCGRPSNDRHHQEFRNKREFGKVDGAKTKIDHSDTDADRLHLGDDHGS